MKRVIRQVVPGMMMLGLLGVVPAFSQTARANSVRVIAAGGSFLGVNVKEIDGERAKALKLQDEHGVEITSVEPDGPADKAGLKTGDVVLEYNGQRIEGTSQFIRMVKETPVGRQVKLMLSRNGAAQTLSATIGQRKGGPMSGGTMWVSPNIEIPEIRIPDIPRANMSWRSSALGVEAEALESQLAEYFGVKDGVLVRSVIKGSAAEKAGLKAGDVIVKVDAAKVTTPREVSSAVRASQSKGAFPLTLMRERKETTVNVTVRDDHSTGERPTRSRSVHFQEL